MAEDQTLRKLLAHQAEHYVDKTFLYWKEDEVSYVDFNIRVNQVANMLQSAGVAHGEKVALLLPNCPEFLYTFFACTKLGAIAVPINPKLKGDEIQYILENSESVALIATNEFVLMRATCAIQCPGLRVTWYVGEGDGNPNFAECWQQPTSTPEANVTGDDILSIIHTSGTTGRPKGVLLS